MSTASAARPGARQSPIAAPAGAALTHAQIMRILLALLLGMFLAALDGTIVATAIRTIGDDLNGLSAQAWVTTAFLITSTISTPLYGKLSDIFGRKPLFMAAIAIFVAGSALCGLSQSMYELAAFRAFQGLGAGGLMALALSIVADIIPPRERARYQGYFMATFASASVLGPLIGGFLAGQASIAGLAGWRWIFWINVPLGVLALFVVVRNLHLDHIGVPQRIDFGGAAAITVGLVPLLIVAEQGREWGWGSTAAFVCYLIGAAGIAAFIAIEIRMGSAALIPFRLFRIGMFRIGSILAVLIGIVLFGGVSTLPLYLQLVKNATPTQSGLLMLPLMLGLMTSSLVAGRFTARTGRYRWLPVIGLGAMSTALILLGTIGADTPLWRVDLFMMLLGAGLGMCMQTLVVGMQNAVPATDIGVTTASATFFRSVGGTLGAAVFLSILFSTVGDKVKAAYQAAFAGKDPDFTAAINDPAVTSVKANADFINSLKNPSGSAIDLNNTSFLSQLDSALAHPFKVGFAEAMDLVFIAGAGVALIGFVISFFIKEVPLRSVSGATAAAAARAEAANAEMADL